MTLGWSQVIWMLCLAVWHSQEVQTQPWNDPNPSTPVPCPCVTWQKVSCGLEMCHVCFKSPVVEGLCLGLRHPGEESWCQEFLATTSGLIHTLVVSPLHELSTEVTILIKSHYFGYYRTPISYLSASVLFASPDHGLLSQLLLSG